MGSPEITPEKYRHDLEVVRNTATQMIRDFGMFGVEIKFSGQPDSAYHELLSQTEPALAKLYNENKSSFMALLYRIDVSENKVNDLLRIEKKPAFFAKLAEVVVEREFMKVLIRKLFSA
jgi:hypothetical protein